MQAATLEARELTTHSTSCAGDRYRMFDQIAGGGMATVHLGRLTAAEGFHRVVAIKRSRPNVARDPELAALFLDEARVAGRIRHPNVVAALDLVESNGELWLVMEYVHGATLASLLCVSPQGRGLPVAIACAIAKDMLHGLHAAHETRGPTGEKLDIVHRDVSPQNVLVGCDGFARVIDFGVVHLNGQQHLTQAGEIKGKLAYLAPERLRGEDPDRRVDVYAAAIVLWEMLTGLKLFDGSSEGEIVAKALSAVVPSPREVNPDIPEPLAEVVMRGLLPEPSARYQTALEMALALEKAARVASAHEVGEWVVDTAGELLAERSRRLTAVEESCVLADTVPDVMHVHPESDTRLRGRRRPAPARASEKEIEIALPPLGRLAHAQTWLSRRANSMTLAAAVALLVVGAMLTPRFSPRTKTATPFEPRAAAPVLGSLAGETMLPAAMAPLPSIESGPASERSPDPAPPADAKSQPVPPHVRGPSPHLAPVRPPRAKLILVDDGF